MTVIDNMAQPGPLTTCGADRGTEDCKYKRHTNGGKCDYYRDDCDQCQHIDAQRECQKSKDKKDK